MPRDRAPARCGLATRSVVSLMTARERGQWVREKRYLISLNGISRQNNPGGLPPPFDKGGNARQNFRARRTPVHRAGVNARPNGMTAAPRYCNLCRGRCLHRPGNPASPQGPGRDLRPKSRRCAAVGLRNAPAGAVNPAPTNLPKMTRETGQPQPTGRP